MIQRKITSPTAPPLTEREITSRRASPPDDRASTHFLREGEHNSESGATGDLVVDTSKMNRGQREALEVTESARERREQQGFAGELFMGRFRPAMLRPFPTQSEEDRRIGDSLVARVSEILRERLDPDEVDESRSIPPEVIDELRRLGIFRMKVPREYGGLGLSQVNYNRVVQAIASYCGSTAVLVSAHQSIGVPQPLKLFGTPQQKEKYFQMICEGALSAFALSEPDVGSDPARMKTRTVRSDDGRHYILNGEKLWTTNGPIAQLLVVMAQTKPRVIRGREKAQITAFIVETDWPGVEVVHRCDFMGLRAIHNGVMRFTNVKVPAENVLWGEGLGLKLALRTLNTGRLTLPAACAGLGKQCLAIARQWGQKREQWGRPIGRHEAGSEKIATIAATTFAMEAVTWLTSHWADQGRDIRIEAAMAKLFCSEAGWRLVDDTMQLRGGRGYERARSLQARGEDDYPVERMMRDSRINRIIEGTTDIMRLFLAREALDPHLVVAADLLRPEIPMRRRLRGALGMARFYSRWYPLRLAGATITRRHRDMGALATHGRFIDRASDRLAAALFHSMVRHGPKLERRQVLLGHLMEIGTELFAMAAACAYAQSGRRGRSVETPAEASQHEGHAGAPASITLPIDTRSSRGLRGRRLWRRPLRPRHPSSTDIQDDEAGDAEPLADLFCRQARGRIKEHFRAARSRVQARANAVAADVLDGRYRWLEEGVISRNGAE